MKFNLSLIFKKILINKRLINYWIYLYSRIKSFQQTVADLCYLSLVNDQEYAEFDEHASVVEEFVKKL